MKKFVTLVLALVMVLAVAVPAMAFTSDTAEAVKHPYELDIYLVEYADNDFFGITTLPPSDRGYAKNEIVAAVVELYVPKDEKILPAEYSKLVFGGDNVSLKVTENYNSSNAIALKSTSNVGTGVTVATALVDDEISLSISSLAGKNTFKWLFFAKVTGDDASLYAKLIDGDGSVGFDTNGLLKVTLGGVNYEVTKGTNAYTVAVKSGDYKNAGIEIKVDSKGKSTGMRIAPATTSSLDYYSIVSTVAGGLGVLVNGEVKTSGSIYEDVMDIYEDIVVDVFKMDYKLIGNYVRDSFWTGVVSADTLVATVEIKPWTAYVTVPDNIVVDPPKTGDAASIVGFVMIVLAAAAVVAVKKVRA